MANTTLDENNLALHDDNYRKSEFKELARVILRKDRVYRKLRESVDTGGEIVRAMEKAYKLGLAHGRGGSVKPTPATSFADTSASDEPIRWLSIPSRYRSIFDRIIRHQWIVIYRENVTPREKESDKWACYWDWGDSKPDEPFELAHTFSLSTISSLVKLGLFDDNDSNGVRQLIPTQKGLWTWQAAVDDGFIRKPGYGEFCLNQTDDIAGANY